MKSMASEVTYNSSRNIHQVGLHSAYDACRIVGGGSCGCVARVPLLCACVGGYRAFSGCKEDEQICYCLETETGLFVPSLHVTAFLARLG